MKRNEMIRMRREEFGWKQIDASYYLDISETAVRLIENYEDGLFTSATLLDVTTICAAFNFNLFELAGFDRTIPVMELRFQNKPRNILISMRRNELNISINDLASLTAFSISDIHELESNPCYLDERLLGEIIKLAAVLALPPQIFLVPCPPTKPNTIIKMRRLALGLSDTEAAKRVGMGLDAYGDVESYEDELSTLVPLSEVINICTVFDLNLFKLLGIDPTMPTLAERYQNLPRNLLVTLRRNDLKLSKSQLADLIRFPLSDVDEMESDPCFFDNCRICDIMDLATALDLPPHIFLIPSGGIPRA